MKFFKAYLKSHKITILAFVIFVVLFIVSFVLYHLPAAAVMYPSVLCLMAGILLFWKDYSKEYKKHKILEQIRRIDFSLLEELPEPDTYQDEDYQEVIESMREQYKTLETSMNIKYQNMIEYYTLWAHQIKTPIASMGLTLENRDSREARKLSADLFRIEQYVEMVLTFLRLDSDYTDYVIESCCLDKIIRCSVKKFSSEFINRKIKLRYEGITEDIVTDEKWFQTVIEQILSNALKYTRQGSISIYYKDNKLYIEDTGIGIAPEDLPRIFENGYTGYNGRKDKRASGIGLYLVKRICTNLGIGIKIESELNRGTTVILDISREKPEFE